MILLIPDVPSYAVTLYVLSSVIHSASDVSSTFPSGAFVSRFTGMLLVSDKFPDISSAVTFTVRLPSLALSSPACIVKSPDTSHEFPSFNVNTHSSSLNVFVPHVTV